MHKLPTGTVTFFFSDIEDSSTLWDAHPLGMRAALARHDELLRSAVTDHDGMVIKTTGDGIYAVFSGALDAVTAAVAAQRALSTEIWSPIDPNQLKARVGLHTGEAEERDGDYHGTAVNRAARLMSIGYGGQILLSGVTATMVTGSLPTEISLRDLGLHPLRGLEGEEHVFQLSVPDLVWDFPPLHSMRQLKGNLPAQLSSFVGRDREKDEVKRMLRDRRLLTLVGPGGTGKTRLSLQVAAELQHHYQHGAWFVELAPVTDPQAVSSAVAAVFGRHGQTREQTYDLLFDYVENKELLLILDNCEHLVDASARLAGELLAVNSRMTILASSREVLGVYGESTYHLPTLSLPEERHVTAESAAKSEAVQLFVERAMVAQPSFRLVDENAAAVSQIVRRLDGIPLAIELAVARLQVFGVDQVAGRLDDRFRLLTGGSRTALPRQQTLRALIDWSYDLLYEDEAALFRRLAIFAGGWTLDSAEFVAGECDVFSLLPRLVGKSLAVADTNVNERIGIAGTIQPGPRYYYLETIRQYARDRLAESGDSDIVRDLHFDYYAGLVRSLESEGKLETTANYLKLELDNLQAAVTWGTDRYPERVLSLVWDLTIFLNDQVPDAALVVWTRAALHSLNTLPLVDRCSPEVRELARLRGLVTLSTHLLFLGQVEESLAIAEEAIPELIEHGDGSLLLGTALFVRAQSSSFLQRPDIMSLATEAREQLEQIDQSMPARAIRAQVIQLAAEVEAKQGNLERARAYHDEATKLVEGIPSGLTPWSRYPMMLMLADTDVELEELRARIEAAVTSLSESGYLRTVALTKSNWAHYLRQHELEGEALAIYQDVLVDWREVGHRGAIAHTLECIAFIDQHQGRQQRAVELLGAAERIRVAANQEMLGAERDEYVEKISELQCALPVDEFDSLWAAGHALSTDDLIALAQV